MNTKNRLIEKLLKVAKKHKILTYPVLALVAVISVFHYFFSWSTGAGKRVVAVVMVLVMLVSQSYFLTSSATALVDTEETVQEQQELQEQMGSDLVDAGEAEEPVETSEEDTGLIESETPTEVVEEEQDTTTEASTESDTEQTDNTEAVADNTEQSQNSSEDTTGTSEDVFTEDGTTEALTEGNTTTEAPAGDVPVFTEDEPNAEKSETGETTEDVSLSFFVQTDTSFPNWSDVEISHKATKAADGTYYIDAGTLATLDSLLTNYNNAYVKHIGWYTDPVCSGDPIDSSTTFSVNAGDTIKLYAKRTLLQYKVTIADQAGTGGEATEVNSVTQGGVGVTAVDGVYPVTVSDESATITIHGVKKTGYTLVDATVNGSKCSPTITSKASRSSTQDITISLSGNQYVQDVALTWQGDEFSIYYSTDEVYNSDTTSKVEKKVTFGGTDMLWSPGTDITNAKPGWIFVGWTVAGYSGVVAAGTVIPSEMYTSLYNDESLVLTPCYEYRGIVFGVDGDYSSQDTVQLEFQYKLSDAGKTITGKHVVNSGNEEFQYELVGGSTTISYLAGYGIDVDVDEDNSITFSTNGPQAITDENITVRFKITDTKSEDDTQNSVTGTVSIKIKPCAVTISDSIIPTKTYNNNRDVDSDIVPNQTKLSVIDGNGKIIEGAYVTFTSCLYDDKNAGDDKRITLSGCSLTCPTGEAGCYTLLTTNEGECYIPGVIKPRKVYVKTSVENIYGRAYVRAGETKNPAMKVVLDTAKNKEENCGFMENDDTADLSACDTYVKPTRNDESLLTASDPKQEYEVWVKAGETSNYAFELNAIEDDNIANFTVKLESITDDMYMISSTMSTDGWYGGSNGVQLLAVADGGYNRVRISESTSWDDAGTFVTLTEENTENNQVRFQLYDSNTGAFTAWKTITVKIDQEAPEFVSYEITEKGTSAPGNGLYFPSLNGTVSFGNYFNKSVVFSIRYKDERSTPDKLYYTLSNTLGGEIKGEQMEYFGEADANGYATAVIEVDAVELQDKLGGIQFRAFDEAGNGETQANTLRRVMDDSSSADEWAVEKTGPEISNWGVSSILEDESVISVKSGADRYYTRCTAHLTAKDITSGIYGVTWYLNDEAYEICVDNKTSKVTEQDFTFNIDTEKYPSEGGLYTIYAVVTDNAGNNSYETEKITFKVDDVIPDVKVIRNYDTYQKEVKLEFFSLDNLSGIQYIKIEDDDGEVKYKVEELTGNVDGFTHYCYMETTKKGNYYIEVVDKAGNPHKETIVLDKVSSEVPPCPTITFSPEANESGWITAKDAKAIITNVLETTEDKTPVDTKYQLWKDGETSMHVTTLSSTASSEDISIPDGIYHLRVWSESRTGIVCKAVGENAENGHLYTIQVDSIEPTIEYELQKGADNSLVVNFTVKDNISGVNGDTIKAYNGNNEVVIKTTALEDGSGYTGSFNITEVGNYSIVASDIAGNETKAPAFKPMSMKVNAVKNISNSSATVGAQIYKGSYAIASANIAYRKITDMQYTETDSLPVLDETTGNMVVSAALSDLAQGTNYAYKVTATSEAGEVLSYEGYFKTLSDKDAGVTIAGTARYLSGEAGYITVGLFDGNACIRATEVNTGESNAFSFSNVPDGNYSIVATDSEFTTTKRILIADGTIIYPDSGTIDLVLSGNNTSVEITTNETPKVTAGNMDSLFNDETNYTAEDKLMVEQGNGTIEFKLYATLMKVSAVGAGEISAMYTAASSRDKIVGAYLDLSLYKVTTDEDGNVSRKQVHNLGGGANISVTIPLGDLADKTGLEVVRIHKNGDNFTGTYLVDQDNNPSTYTIVSSQYSTYAVLHDPEVEEEPTTEAPTTEAIVDGTIAPSYNGSIYNTTEDNSISPDDEKNKDVDDKEKDDDKDDKKSGSSVGSLTSSGSAKTGDATPVMLLFGMMLVSIGGVIVLRKKVK